MADTRQSVRLDKYTQRNNKLLCACSDTHRRLHTGKTERVCFAACITELAHDLSRRHQLNLAAPLLKNYLRQRPVHRQRQLGAVVCVSSRICTSAPTFCFHVLNRVRHQVLCPGISLQRSGFDLRQVRVVFVLAIAQWVRHLVFRAHCRTLHDCASAARLGRRAYAVNVD